MHVSMFLGFWDGVVSVASKVVNTILGLVLRLVINYILVPLIQILIVVIKYVFSGIFFAIGTFILRLIDVMEAMFRLFAGLINKEGFVEVGDFKASLSLGDTTQTGDILIQIIRNDAVKDAFLSMVIVGLFLLLVTTVFQMIKVEYTTEGAKNSKTPIIQKAFRSLANLLLLPALVVLGILFSNSLLGLLDDATQGGSNKTISGVIFSTSASTAFYKNNVEKPMEISGVSMWDIAISAVTESIEPMMDELFNNADNDATSGRVTINDVLEYIPREITFTDILANFESQTPGFKYYDVTHVSSYFNLAEINYIVMIFGGGIVIKCLFFTCFGLINRLYKCVMLFVISPVVIGMTPINEGGLGKWRTAFIGQVLAAYGTVITLNLFFKILEVMLNIKITFKMGDGLLQEGPLTSAFLSGLLKVIIVVAGFLLIENFAKDIGGYFGADDAMASGKDTAGKVGDTVRKGVTTVAAGGAMLAVGAMALKKGGQGLADKMKKRKEGKHAERADAKEMKSVSGELAEKDNAIHDIDTQITLEQEKLKYGETHGKIGHRNAAKKRIKELETTRAGLVGDKSKLEEKKSVIEERQKAREEKKEEEKQQRKDAVTKVVSTAGVRATSTLMGLAQQGMNSAPGGKWRDFIRKAEGDGSKLLGGNYETATSAANKAREDRLVKVGETVGGKAESAYMQTAVILSTEQMIESYRYNSEKMVQDLTAAINNTAKMLKDTDDAKERNTILRSAYTQMQSQGLDIDYDKFKDHLLVGGKITGDIHENIKLDAKDLGITVKPEAIEAAVKKAMKNGHDKSEIIEAVKKEFENGSVAQAKLLTKVIEEAISNASK